MDTRNLPTITILGCSLNFNLKIFKDYFERIKMQDYPVGKIEHIILDGGSENGVVELVKNYKCNLIIREDLKKYGQRRMAIGIKKAKGELILFLEPDNLIIGKNWIKQMVKPFIENKKLICSFSMHNSFEKDMNTMTKYTALTGSPDPTLYYLGKSEKVPLTTKQYNKGDFISKKREYTIIEFNSQNLPTLGDNGHMVNARLIKKTFSDISNFTHTDSFAQIVEDGPRQFAAVNNSIIHMVNGNVINAVKARMHYKMNYYDFMRGRRKYLVYNPKVLRDRMNLLKFALLSSTIVQPLAVSILGYLKIKDKAWFIHPIFSFLMVLGYGYTEVRFFLKKIVA